MQPSSTGRSALGMMSENAGSAAHPRKAGKKLIDPTYIADRSAVVAIPAATHLSLGKGTRR